MQIEGNNQNEIRFSIHGRALATFKKNRAGLCILHPVKSCAGKSCKIITTEGKVLRLAFPGLIAPHQPFRNIKKMRWTTGSNTSCEIIFEGDTFETEDQRNWTDASFKTYSTPLDLPFPVTLKEGDTINQKITFLVSHKKEFIHIQSTEQERAFLTFDPTKPLTLPDIGSSRPMPEKTADSLQGLLLRKLQLDHYRVDIKLYDKTWWDCLQKVFSEAKLLDAGLKIALHLSDENELSDFIAAISDDFNIITELLLLGPSKITNEGIIKRFIPILKKTIPGIKVGGGTDCYFADLNRNTLDTTSLDFASFSLNPQVHAFDDLTLIENMEAQYDAVISAGNQYPHLPVHISPVTLKPRFNPDSVKKYISGNMPLDNTPDSRQHTIFAAGWTLGSLRNLAAAGAASITYYETIGSMGIIPDPLDSSKVTISPVYLLFRLIMEFKHGKLFAGKCNIAMKCTGILILNGRAKRWIIANHSSRTLQIVIDNLTGEAWLRKLSTDNRNEYLENPDLFITARGTPIQSGIIQLDPYAIGIVDKTN